MKIKSNIYVFLVLISAIGLFSFSTGKTNLQTEKIISINHGSSFGMCEGYCTSEVIYSENNIILLQKKWRDSDKDMKSDTIPITKTDWNDLNNSFDTVDFFKLKRVYGCPDCADGGSEWIEIKTKSRTQKVTFEYGKNDIPDLKKLLDLVRKIEK